jgi:hypothetical protein
MLRFNPTTIKSGAILAMGMVLLLVLLGCEKNSPVAPLASSDVLVSKPLGSSSIEAASDIGSIWILQDAQAGLAKVVGCDSLWHKKEYIKSSQGGLIEIGDLASGRSSIQFQQNALPKDTAVSMDRMHRRDIYDCQSLSFVFEFGPEGTVFLNTVTVTLSYRTADLSGVPEDNLKIFYYNPIRNLWEYLESVVDKENKTITAELEHFSRYAIAFSR